MSGLGSLLLKRGVITSDQLVAAMADQRSHGGPLAASLVKLGYVRDDDLVNHLYAEYRIPLVDLQSIEPNSEVLALVSPAVATKHSVLPISRSGSTLTLAVADPSHLVAINEVKFVSGCNVRIMLAQLSMLDKAIQKHYSKSAKAYEEVFTKLSEEKKDNKDDVDLNELQRAMDEAPVVKLVSTLMHDAIEKRASDIHIEPYEQDLRVRFRIDGVLHEIMQPPLRLKAAIASRIKVMASLDIAERRLPQDGGIKIKTPEGQEINLRVSVLPAAFGEKVVMRVLAKTNLQPDLDKLGFDEAALHHFKKAIAQPSGMVLVTGPTGSGKTTTLYSALSVLNESSRNICTAEDPVEIYMRGVNQVKVNDEIGLTFAACLRSFLRQDPDVIMVGEIRDSETIEIGVKAALTGHLVLSTLHTNDAPSTITRMLNMGIEPFLVSSSTNLIMAQRLVRKICAHCRVVAEDYPLDALREVGFTDQQLEGVTLYRGEGCEECSKTGYTGRLAIYEMLPVTERIRELVIARASADTIRHAATEEGMKPLRQAGIDRVLEGLTTVEETLRVTTAE